jgi:hypothetical protein
MDGFGNENLIEKSGYEMKRLNIIRRMLLKSMTKIQK